MSLCLNPDCPKPQNRNAAIACRACGSRLLLKDRYRAVRLIGQGGFGKTWLAIDEDKPSKPRCVIKQFLPLIQEARHVKKAAALFEREATQLEELGHHPQIPELLAYFNQDQRQYLVQEFIDGKTLIEVLQAQGAFSQAQVQEVLVSLLPVLEFIHDRGVIHRDIKPPNIIATPGSPILGGQNSQQTDWNSLLQALSQEITQGFRDFPGTPYPFSELLGRSLFQLVGNLPMADQNRCKRMVANFANYSKLTLPQRQYLVAEASHLIQELSRKQEHRIESMHQGQLVLVDFGAVKLATAVSLAHTGTAIGSPEYLAPEQARGKAGFASDLYSLGVTCLHLLTGRSPSDLFDPHQNVWVWKRYLPNPISQNLERILDKLVEPGIDHRYQSASEVLLDLDVQADSNSQLDVPLEEQVLDNQNVLAPQPAKPLAAKKREASPMDLGPPQNFGSSLPISPLPLSPLPPIPPPSDRLSFDLVVQNRQRPSIPLENFAQKTTAPQTTAPKTSPKSRSARQKTPATWQCTHSFPSPGKVFAIALSPTEMILASSSGTTIRLWDLQTGQALRTLTGHLDIVSCLAITPDGNLLISGSADKTIRLWDLHTGNRLASIALHTDTVRALAITPKGDTLASSSFYDPIALLDIHTGKPRHQLQGHTSRVDALAFSNDGNLLASGSGDALIKLWNVAAGKEIRTLQGHTQQVATIAFSPDSKTLVSGSWDGTVKLWSLQTYRPKRSLELERGRVNAISFSPDGKTLAIGSDILQLWNPRTGQLVTQFEGHRGAIAAVTFQNPTSRDIAPLLASASWDGTIRIWHLTH